MIDLIIKLFLLVTAMFGVILIFIHFKFQFMAMTQAEATAALQAQAVTQTKILAEVSNLKSLYDALLEAQQGSESVSPELEAAIVNLGAGFTALDDVIPDAEPGADEAEPVDA